MGAMITTSLYEPLNRREPGLVDAGLRKVEAAGGMDLPDAVVEAGARAGRSGAACRAGPGEPPSSALGALITNSNPHSEKGEPGP